MPVNKLPILDLQSRADRAASYRAQVNLLEPEVPHPLVAKVES